MRLGGASGRRGLSNANGLRHWGSFSVVSFYQSRACNGDYHPTHGGSRGEVACVGLRGEEGSIFVLTVVLSSRPPILLSCVPGLPLVAFSLPSSIQTAQ
eukprot:scaffold1009_cov188-Alexandrium_tamarense.AAC.19